ncbi:hypothetical protein [Halosegnis longus]|uniref:hypothetical protein n=1 Tax=Halosegnis longus TaxID=2216012 RepID=UPI00129D3E32|nr:hypothetical protein [Halosegnis longus]
MTPDNNSLGIVLDEQYDLKISDNNGLATESAVSKMQSDLAYRLHQTVLPYIGEIPTDDAIADLASVVGGTIIQDNRITEIIGVSVDDNTDRYSIEISYTVESVYGTVSDTRTFTDSL